MKNHFLKSYWTIAIVLFSLIAFLNQIYIAKKIENNPSSKTDIYTEVTTYNSAKGYYDLGFSSNSGLPNFCYGNEEGSLTSKILNTTEADCVYTHYPQGSEILAGVSMNLWGPNQYFNLRILPMALCFLAHFFLIFILLKTIGEKKTFFINLFLLIIPMYTSMMHGVYFQGMVVSLLLAQVALALLFFNSGSKFSLQYLCGFFGLGFLQGWLSFDHCFLATFFHVPFLILLGAKNNRLRLFLQLSLLSGGGYTFAQILHFVQVVFYSGGLDAAILDFKSSANERANILNVSALALIKDYWVKWAKLRKNFNFDLIYLWVGLQILIGVFGFYSKDWKKMFNQYFALWSCTFITALWMIVMRQHSFHHAHYITRHLFLFYFFAVWFLFSQVSWNFKKIYNFIYLLKK